MEKRNLPNGSPLAFRRHNRGTNAYPNSLPGSRSSSPGRNVMTKRAIFEENNVSKNTGLSKKGNEVAEIKIEGVEEFDKIYNSTWKQSTALFESKPSPNNSESEKILGEIKSDNTARRRIVPDYVSIVSKPVANQNEGVSSSSVSECKRNSKRVRNRGEGSRYQTLQVRSSYGNEKSRSTSTVKQPYLPAYIQPMPNTSGAKDFDAYSQVKRDTINSSSISSEPRTRTQDQRKNPQLRNRLPSSGDSSNSDLPPTNTESLKPMDYLVAKQLQASDLETNRQMSRNMRRQQRQQRQQNVQQQTPENETYNKGSIDRFNQQTVKDINGSKPQISYPAVGLKSIQSAEVIGRRGRPRRRPRAAVATETEEKYSTVPADFRPAEAANDFIKLVSNTETAQTKSSETNRYKNCDENRNELIITDGQTRVALEDVRKKKADVNKNIAYHLVYNQSLQTNQSTDKSAVATSQKGFGESAVRSKQIEDLKNIFNAEQQGTIEFGIAYNKKPPSQVAIRRVKEPQKIETEHVTYSQPMLKVTKIGEDYWPRDADTEKLLKRNSSSKVDTKDNAESASEDTSINSEASQNLSVKESSLSEKLSKSVAMLRSPKETNLCDPVEPSSPSTCSASHSFSFTPAEKTKGVSLDKWELHDPDSKLKDFDQSFESSGGDLSKSHPGSDVHEFLFKNSDDLLSDIAFPVLRSIEMKGKMLYLGQDHQTIGQTYLEETKIKEEPKCLDNKATKQPEKITDPWEYEIPAQTTATCPRKTSVSQSTALKRQNLFENRNSVESVDEGCCVDMGSASELSNSGKLDTLHLLDAVTVRRRRKGSAANGQNGSDSSNGESNRSLSDPTASRRKSPNNTEEETGAVDSNFQYPLKPKGSKDPNNNRFDDARSEVSDCVSMQSSSFDAMQNIINEPHDFDQALEMKGNKVAKKKSFSDPDSTAVITAGLINKMDADLDRRSISSSDPNLVAKADVSGSVNEIIQGSSLGWKLNDSQSVSDITQSLEQMSQSLATDNHVSNIKQRPIYSEEKSEILNENDSFFGPIREREVDKDLQLTENQERQSTIENPFEQEEEQFNQICNEMMNQSDSSTSKASIAHLRSCSEPVVMDTYDEAFSRKVSAKGRRPGIVQAPSLSDVLLGNGSSQQEASPKSDRRGGMTSATLPRTATPRGLDYRNYHSGAGKLELRKHVVDSFLSTEQSYVNSLQVVNEVYIEPLNRPENFSLCEPRLVKTIFYRIPELLDHHQKFCKKIQHCCNNWNTDTKIGELFTDAFIRDWIVELYVNYVNNFLDSKKAISMLTEAKPSFKSFLEQCSRENKEKHSLADLLIQPVQRIPRYEMLIQDLLKHTPDDHPDAEGLLTAKRKIHSIAVQIDQGEKAGKDADRNSRLLLEIEQAIEGSDISGVRKRKFLHQHFCVEVKSGSKKERCLWLFNDLLVCSTVKKIRSQTLRRSSINLTAITQDPAYDIYCKYKFIWKFPIENVDLRGGIDPIQQIEIENQRNRLHDDQRIFIQIDKMSKTLHWPCEELNNVVSESLEAIQKEILEKDALMPQNSMEYGRVEIILPSPEGPKLFLFDFVTDAQQREFVRLFWEVKRNRTSSSSGPAPIKSNWEPGFLKSIAINKTRNGMQFSCAASNIQTSPGTREVWVCNTDGYVGQVCFLSLDPEPMQTHSLAVCNAKICCITQVPSWERRLVPTESLIKDISKVQLPTPAQRRPSSNNNRVREIMPFDENSESDEDNTSPISTINTTSPYSTFNMSPYNTFDSAAQTDEEMALPIVSPLKISPVLCGKFSFASTDHTHSLLCSTIKEDLVESDLQPSDSTCRQNSLALSYKGGGGAYKKDNDGFTQYGSLDNLLKEDNHFEQEENEYVKEESDITFDSDLTDGSKELGVYGSMWLGTEDGRIQIFSTAEAVRTSSKSKFELHHSSSIHCILNHEDQVLVALSNGDLICYSRDHSNGGFWDFENTKVYKAFSSNNPISKMLIVNERELWCGCQNQIRIVDIKTHEVKSSFTVSNDAKRQINCMATWGYGIWVALDKKPQIRLYHSVTHDLITEVDVSHSVSKMLSRCDAIIRQHKAACLRITAMLVCKDLLWVGTSAGVVLTMALPTLTEKSTPIALPLGLQPQGLCYGHTGHVRFLTSVEIGDKDTAARGRMKRRSSMTSQRSSTLVISGGDGYEEFQASMSNEPANAGREDSTNHLLLWKV